MSTKENLMPLSEKRENQKALFDASKIINSKDTSKHVNTTLISKPGLRETNISRTKLQVETDKSANAITYKKEKEQDVLVYTPENSRRSPSPHSIEKSLEYPESKINIHHRKEPKFSHFEPITITKPTTTSTSSSKLKELEKELQDAIKQKEELTNKVQSARKDLKSKNQQAQKIDQKMQQMTKCKANIEFHKQEIIENQSIYEELISILETANEKGLQFGQVLDRYDDQVNELLNALSLTNYRIQEFKESHSPCKRKE